MGNCTAKGELGGLVRLLHSDHEVTGSNPRNSLSTYGVRLLTSTLLRPHQVRGSCTSPFARPLANDNDSDHDVEFVSGNVQLITTKEAWDQKLEQARHDGKIDFSSSWDIKATPTFFFLRDGEEIDKLVGANKPELEKKIGAVTKSPT
ncbi:hypothetical protein TanjilG_10010 [Lupinus angustifolius]|uniref:Thioredoxin domain-containing protein n=1 Tax=Lupinus angustifolius TaxID=3871 RepID=A0A1J7GKH9_LUPAN|nr:hypothetical protein TanjilG_10010 [Lupinus angustifolius]